jgi:hypothetical protein
MAPEMLCLCSRKYPWIAEFPTMIVLPSRIAGVLFAMCPWAGVMPTVPSAPVRVAAYHYSPGLAWRAG